MDFFLYIFTYQQVEHFKELVLQYIVILILTLDKLCSIFLYKDCVQYEQEVCLHQGKQWTYGHWKICSHLVFLFFPLSYYCCDNLEQHMHCWWVMKELELFSCDIFSFLTLAVPGWVSFKLRHKNKITIDLDQKFHSFSLIVACTAEGYCWNEALI